MQSELEFVVVSLVLVNFQQTILDYLSNHEEHHQAHALIVQLHLVQRITSKSSKLYFYLR